MKILKLYIKNINSFRGEHHINFIDEPLASSRLYIISGPTGAGKSTILDAMCLALYGNTPRLGQVTTDLVEKNGAIVTKGTEESSVELTYTVKSSTYVSRWAIKKSRTKNWGDYTMSLAKDGEYLTGKKSEVQKLNAEIIGLTTTEFYTSILLSQGEFAKFLKSDTKQRTELLEKLTGTSIFRKLGIKAFEKNKAFVEEYENLKRLAASIDIKSEEEINQINVSLKQASDQRDTLELQLKGIIEEIHYIKQLNEKSQLLIDKDKELDKLNYEDNSNLNLKQKLKKHNQLNPFRERIQEHSTLQADIDDSKIKISTCKASILTEENSIASHFSQLEEIVGQKVNPANFQSLMRDIETAYDLDKQNLKTIVQSGKDIRSSIKEKVLKTLPDLADKILDISQPSSQLIFLDELINEGKQKLSGNKDNQINTFEEYVKINADIDNKINTLESQLRELDEELTLRKSIITLEKDKSKIENEITINNKVVHDHNNDLLAYQKQLDALEEKQQEFMDEHSLEPIKQKLKIGDACPICGQEIKEITQHLLQEIGLYVLQIDNLKSKIKLAQIQENNFKNSITKLETQLEILIKDLEFNNTKLKYTDLKTVDELLAYIEPLLESLISHRDQSEHLKSSYQTSQRLIRLGEVKQDVSELNDLLFKYNSLKNDFDQKYKKKVITTITNQIQDSYNISKTNLENMKGEMTSLVKRNDEKMHKIEDLERNLKPALAKLSYSNIQAAKEEILSDYDFQYITSIIESIDKKKSTLEGEITNIRREILKLSESRKTEESLEVLNSEQERLKKSIAELNQAIGSNQAMLQDNDQRFEKKKQIENQMASLDQSNKKWVLLKELIGDASGDKFNTFAQSLTLTQLLQIANTRLATLTDRYMLMRSEDHSDLQVIDFYMGNAQRSVKTLSGGETFLLSLALSLSLSDIASRNNVIECLYIDEGFGTLDQETLEMAINTLENLQYQTRKSIGIISHVQSLKERIGTRIEISKNERGFSSFSVVSN